MPHLTLLLLRPTFTTNNNNNNNNHIQIMPMQHAPKYEPPRYTCPNSVLSLQQQQQQQLELVPQQQQQQQQRQYALYSQQPPLPQLPPKPALRSYLKPLPKLPADIEESREMSSTDDLSSRPHSPSMSSSDESYSKTTEGEGDGDEDSPRINGGHLISQRNGHGNGISMGMGVLGYNGLNPRVNPLQWLYPCDIQVDPSSPVVDMTQLRDFELSSTTESQGQQTTSNATSNTQHKGDSCNSFDYQKTAGMAVPVAAVAVGTTVAATKSPFERELQRLLNESSRARAAAAAAAAAGALTTATPTTTTTTTTTTTGAMEQTTSNCSSRHNVVDLSYSASNSKLSSINGHNGQGMSLTAEGGSSSNGNLSGGSNSNSGNNNNHHKDQQHEHEHELLAMAMQVSGKLPMSNSFMISKHPVGLEAIKEITRHKNPSESSQM